MLKSRANLSNIVHRKNWKMSKPGSCKNGGRKSNKTSRKAKKPQTSRKLAHQQSPKANELPVFKQAIENVLRKLKHYDVMVHNLIRARLESVPISWSHLLDEVNANTNANDFGFVVLDNFIKSPDQLAPLLLQELMHSVGGTELDAEAYVAWIYPKHAREQPVTPQDFASFQEEGGKFTKWNKNTGKVTHLRTNKNIAKFKNSKIIKAPRKGIAKSLGPNSSNKFGCCKRKQHILWLG
jgi:hypothetical protein